MALRSLSPLSRQNQAWRATAQSVIRLGRPRIVRDDSGGEALAIDVTPIKTVVSVNGKILAERSYEDVPRLDAKSFTASEPPSASRPIASGPIKLEAAFIDLLAASAVGDRLSSRGAGAYGRPAMAYRERPRLCRAAVLRGRQARAEPDGGGRPGASFRPVGEGEYPGAALSGFCHKSDRARQQREDNELGQSRLSSRHVQFADAGGQSSYGSGRKRLGLRAPRNSTYDLGTAALRSGQRRLAHDGFHSAFRRRVSRSLRPPQLLRSSQSGHPPVA